MKNKYKEILDPNNILIDDRSISDSILLVKKLSETYTYYNKMNKPDGIAEQNKKRLNFISKFDHSSTLEIKLEVFQAFLEHTNQMLININNWYTSSKKNNFSSKNNKIEVELERAIESKISEIFNDYVNYLKFFKEKELIKDFNSLIPSIASSIFGF